MPVARPNLVERDGELAVLRGALRSAADGHGAVGLITGPPGIGKTSLTAALVAHAGESGVAVVRGRAVPDEGSPPLWPWWQALQHRPDLLEVLDRQLAVDGAPADQVLAQRLRDFERLLGSLAGEPTLVVLEDLHWADDLTLHLLRQAGGRPGLLVVATYRDIGQPDALLAAAAELRRDPGTALIRLRPWHPAGTARFVGDAAHPSWIPVLHRTSGGNPLLAGELLTALTDAGLAGGPAPGTNWPLGVPAQLLDMVRARLAGLSPACLDVVSACAVAGLDTQPAVVATLTGMSETAVRAAADGSAGLVRVDELISFEHALVRDAVYDTVPAARRAQLHAATADLIDAGAAPGESVTHRLRCVTDETTSAVAVAACRAAAERARGWLALRRAAELLDAALGVYRGPARPRVELMLDAADLEYAAGRTDSALHRCEAAADLAERHDLPDLIARAALVVRGVVGPLNRPILTLCERALARLPESEASWRARVLAQRALLIADLIDPADADRPSKDALRLAESAGDPLAIADALRARQQVQADFPGVTERLALATRLLDLGGAAPRGSELWARLWRIDAALQLGNMATLAEELTRLQLLTDELGWPLAHWHLHRCRGVRELLLGRFAAARAEADETLRWAKEIQDSTAVSVNLPFRVELARLTGNYDVTDRVLTALEGADMPVLHAGSGAYLFDAGHPERAEWCLDQLRPQLKRLPRDGRWLPTVAEAGQLAVKLGDLQTVHGCYRMLLPAAGYYLATGAGSVLCEGAIPRQLGLFAAALGDTEAARSQLTRGIAMDDRIGAIAYRTLGEITLAEATGDARLAERAELTARRLGMAPAASAAAALRGNLGADRAAAGGLTRREREILGLLVAAKANRQIAEELVLSERTVETHVSNVLGKLGVRSRAEAVAWAREHGY